VPEGSADGGPSGAVHDDAAGGSPDGAPDAGVVVTLAQYAAGELRIVLDGGPEARPDDGPGGGPDEIVLRVDTDYPHDGRVRIEVIEAPERPVTLCLRVPHWADGATLTVLDGTTTAVGTGWVTVGPAGARSTGSGAGSVATGTALTTGDVVTLDLPVGPRLTWPDPRVDAVRGTVAVERGPLVLALESVDLPDGVAIEQVRLDPGVVPRAEGDGAVVRARAVTLVAGRAGTPPFGGAGPVDDLAADRAADPAAEQGDGATAVLELPFVPYHRWAERGPSTMRVFVPTTSRLTTSREESR